MPFVNPALSLSDSMPAPEKTEPVPGNNDQGARSDHSHPRLTSATIQSLGTDGTVQVAFTRQFSAMPAVACLLYETTDAQPVVFKLKTWVRDGNGNYTGCVIQGYRSSILPALSGILLLGNLISSLANYNVFGGSAAGAQFCCIVLQPSN